MRRTCPGSWRALQQSPQSTGPTRPAACCCEALLLLLLLRRRLPQCCCCPCCRRCRRCQSWPNVRQTAGLLPAAGQCGAAPGRAPVAAGAAGAMGWVRSRAAAGGLRRPAGEAGGKQCQAVCRLRCCNHSCARWGMQQDAVQSDSLKLARSAQLCHPTPLNSKPHLDSQPIQQGVHAHACGPARQASLQRRQPSRHCAGCCAAPHTGGRSRLPAAAAPASCCRAAAAGEPKVKRFQLEVKHHHRRSGCTLAGMWQGDDRLAGVRRCRRRCWVRCRPAGSGCRWWLHRCGLHSCGWRCSTAGKLKGLQQLEEDRLGEGKGKRVHLKPHHHLRQRIVLQAKQVGVQRRRSRVVVGG